jgi:hypothetical protein
MYLLLLCTTVKAVKHLHDLGRKLFSTYHFSLPGKQVLEERVLRIVDRIDYTSSMSIDSAGQSINLDIQQALC